MNSLLEERRKRIKDKVKIDNEQRNARSQPTTTTAPATTGDVDLKKLVQSVKRKTTRVENGPAKRKKVS